MKINTEDIKVGALLDIIFIEWDDATRLKMSEHKDDRPNTIGVWTEGQKDGWWKMVVRKNEIETYRYLAAFDFCGHDYLQMRKDAGEEMKILLETVYKEKVQWINCMIEDPNVIHLVLDKELKHGMPLPWPHKQID